MYVCVTVSVKCHSKHINNNNNSQCHCFHANDSKFCRNGGKWQKSLYNDFSCLEMSWKYSYNTQYSKHLFRAGIFSVHCARLWNFAIRTWSQELGWEEHCETSSGTLNTRWLWTAVQVLCHHTSRGPRSTISLACISRKIENPHQPWQPSQLHHRRLRPPPKPAVGPSTPPRPICSSKNLFVFVSL